jgi:dienelactone hydrolase
LKGLVLKTTFLVIAIVYCLTARAQSFEELLKPENLSQSWIKATVYEPESIFPKTIEFLNKPSKYPVLIYMHGCTGLNDDSREWARTIKNLGFIVVQPDSFAIPGRRSNCDPKAQRGQIIKGFNSFKLRNQELRYARNELLKLAWLEKNKIYLMGHSEGGMAVSRTPVGGFRAIISSGYWCHERLEIKHGSSPFLFINWEDDPWFRSRAENRNPEICQQLTEKRKGTKQLILKGEGHATSLSSSAKQAVENFLKANLQTITK